MALTATLKKQEAGFAGELMMSDVYFKVIYLVGDKLQMTASLVGNKNGTTVFSREILFPIDLESKQNFISQAYNFVKTLPEFSDAKDC
jgi:hypothetical protein